MRLRSFFFMCALFGVTFAGTSLHATPRVEIRTYGVHHWRLTIETVRFSGDVACRLYLQDHKSFYVANALGFRVAFADAAAGSWFRIDNGPPQRWRDQLPQLARLRVAIDGPDMDRPTGSVVWLPMSLVKDAVSVQVATERGTKLRKFDLRGFSELHAAALYLGCAPEGRFVQ